MSFTGVNPIETRSVNNEPRFDVNDSKLDPSQVHIFYASEFEPRATKLALLALEHITFNPSNPEASSLLKAQSATLNTLRITWISFPKKQQVALKNIAKIYNLTVSTESRYMVTEGCTFHISGSPRTLTLHPTAKTNTDMSHSEIADEIDRILWFGKQLERLGVD